MAQRGVGANQNLIIKLLKNTGKNWDSKEKYLKRIR